MKEIFKILSNYKWLIILIIALLVGQAYCDLALPEYTSNIVNVGIQESGIESITPIKIRKSEFDSILTNIDNKEEIIKNYESDNDIYTLREEVNLDDKLLIPMASHVLKIDKSIIENQYQNNESLLKSAIINYLKGEYKNIGISLEDMQMNYIYKVGFRMIIVALIAMAITILSVYLSSKVATGFGRDLREKLVSKIMSFERQDLKEFSQASLITRCTNDVNQIQGVLMAFLRIIIFAPIMAIGAITKVKDFSLSWVIIVSVIAILILMLVLFIVVVPKFKKFQELLDRLNLVSREQLNGLEVIRAFANEREEEKRFDKANNDLTKNGLFVNHAMSIMLPTLTFIMNSVAILIIWVGSKEVNNFDMQVGDLIAFITYTMQIIMSFLMIGVVSIMLPRAIVSLKRMGEIFDTKRTIFDKDKTAKFQDKENYVEFKDVYFRYPNAEEDVLRNISFVAKQGTTTAFIGGTGSGKSTIINLIPRFYDVTSGKIIINGEDIRNVKIKDLRKKIGYVPQKGKLFKGTIKSNVSFGQDKYDEEKVLEAIKISASSEIIEEDEKGLNREINEGGSNVSGGQRQRLSIARALAKDSDIYIFDDSFSALDFKTDSLVRKELKKVTKDKIVFIVAQRVSSIMNADNIIVLNEGQIVGMGKHEELLKTCDIYKEICKGQLGGDL